MAGDAAGQLEQSLEPVVLGLAEFLHIHEAFRAAEQRADRDDEDVVQAMRLAALDARVWELTEVVAEAVGRIGHPKLLPSSLPKVHF